LNRNLLIKKECIIFNINLLRDHLLVWQIEYILTLDTSWCSSVDIVTRIGVFETCRTTRNVPMTIVYLAIVDKSRSTDEESKRNYIDPKSWFQDEIRKALQIRTDQSFWNP
jgi:hypothetical protein